MAPARIVPAVLELRAVGLMIIVVARVVIAGVVTARIVRSAMRSMPAHMIAVSTNSTRRQGQNRCTQQTHRNLSHWKLLAAKQHSQVASLPHRLGLNEKEITQEACQSKPGRTGGSS